MICRWTGKKIIRIMFNMVYQKVTDADRGASEIRSRRRWVAHSIGPLRVHTEVSLNRRLRVFSDLHRFCRFAWQRMISVSELFLSDLLAQISDSLKDFLSCFSLPICLTDPIFCEAQFCRFFLDSILPVLSSLFFTVLYRWAGSMGFFRKSHTPILRHTGLDLRTVK